MREVITGIFIVSANTRQLFLGRGVVAPATGQNQGPLGLFQLLQDRADNPLLRASPPGNGIRPVKGSATTVSASSW